MDGNFRRNREKKVWRLRFVSLLFTFHVALLSLAQYNTDRLIISGRIALSNHDFVVAIQHFNNVLSVKPYLYEPWYYRGICKLQLDDYVGAESDFDKALELNPYVHEIFAARAESRIRQKKYADAVADYEQALKFSPDERGYWFNRSYCRYFMKENEQAHADLEYIVSRWPDMNLAYALQTELYLNENDTTTASQWLDRTLERNPYDGNSWSILARLNMQRKNWTVADSAFTKAIHYQPRVVNNYMYRAMVRVNLNRLRQAMDDYDMAIDMDPNNFLSHYNRGLLRQQLGDDNRAIEDFNFVLRHEPNNLQALYNRALLLDRTGNYRAAIADYSRVIETFPNFWAGLLARAQCYRKLGMNGKAELDEFRVTKAQLDKHLGIQQRWSKNKLREMRKLSDIDVEKYDQWVVIDDEVTTPEYKNDYRGSVQNRDVETELLPMFSLSLMPHRSGLNNYRVIDHSLEQFIHENKPLHPIFVVCKHNALNESESRSIFALIDSLGSAISASRDVSTALGLLMQRAVAHATTHNFAEAVNDLDDYLAIDSTSVLAHWQRAFCLHELSDYGSVQNTDVKFGQSLSLRRIDDDLARAIVLDNHNALLLYNRATLKALQKDYAAAIDGFEQALALNPNLAEAYFNLGLTHIFAGDKAEGIKNLSKAGELGLYDAYSLIKRYDEK
ncbi:MAG: tetratricopeptide repeat protein [Prevotella sp.]|nr:tetratricopeptide repeat protein [Prevotella sp.]